MHASVAVCDAINRIRGPFNTTLMQQLVAVAALKDRDHFWAAVRHNNQWLAWITAELRTLGLRVDDSAANFVLIHFPKGTKSAAAADAFLMKHGVILRGVANYGLPDCLRMTVGTEEQNRLAVSLLRQFMTA
jgi:histidinol-phosphate aminotransferase